VSTAPSPASTPASGGLSDNNAGLIAYITIIPAIIFLVMEPYNKNKYIRFHAFQSLFFGIAWMVLCFFWVIPIIGWLIGFLGGIAFFVVWIILLIKASKGEKWKLPVIGDLAEQQANS